MHHTTSVTCVGGMLRVLPSPSAPPSVPPSASCVGGMLQVTPAPSAPASPPAPVSPPVPTILTQKQVRELRRLCRKTANRAEFDDRLIQLRQIASIAAMAAPSAPLFDPHNPSSGLPLRRWVDHHRRTGADWRDERPLPDDAVDELRRWDRALKAWARLRFGPAALDDPVDSLHSSCPPPGFAKVAPSPATPVITKSRLPLSEYSHFSSPVSPDTLPLVPSPIHPTFVSRVHAADEALVRGPLPCMPSVSKGQLLSEVSINRIGDIINVTVPSRGRNPGQENDDPRLVGVEHNDQENLAPTMARRSTYLHAANTAHSWRNVASEDAAAAADNALGSRSMSKTLPGLLKATPGTNTTTAVGQVTQRSAMDWGNLRRPALRTLPLNSIIGKQSLPKTS